MPDRNAGNRDAYPFNNQIKSMHFRMYKKTRKQWRRAVRDAARGRMPAEPVQPVERAYLEIERYSAGSLDWDNAYGGLKPLFDYLVVATPRNPNGLGLIREDAPRYMPTAPAVTQHPAKRGRERRLSGYSNWQSDWCCEWGRLQQFRAWQVVVTAV